jgi:hypothetical protein
VVIVDGFHPDPDALRAAAETAAFEPAHRHYPGVRAPLPDDYFTQVRPVLAPVLAQVFGVAAIRLIDASFSIVTAAPDALTTEQRLPHVDAVVPGRVALVHYLSDAGGGTAFFRHRATGYESIDEARSDAYRAALAAEIAREPPPAAYVAGSTALFEAVDIVEAKANRAVIYASAMLHSGAIPADAVLDADPRRGRLTVTAFFGAG